MDDHAHETLRYIRSSMDAAALVATPGSAGIVIGLVGVLASLLAAGPWRAHWVSVWIAAAPLAALLGATVMVRQQRLQGRTPFGASARRFALCLAPPLLAGAALTAADLSDGNLRVVAATWLLLYGCTGDGCQRHDHAPGGLAWSLVPPVWNRCAVIAGEHPQSHSRYRIRGAASRVWRVPRRAWLA